MPLVDANASSEDDRTPPMPPLHVASPTHCYPDPSPTLAFSLVADTSIPNLARSAATSTPLSISA